MIDKNYCPDCHAFLPSEQHKPMCEINTKTDIDRYGQFTCDMWLSGTQTIHNIRNMDEAEAARNSLSIMALGLAGESGEVLEHIKKILRDGTFRPEDLKKEFGDVVYYWARLIRFFGWQPSEILAANIEKLESRKARGTMRGSGDNR